MTVSTALSRNPAASAVRPQSGGAAGGAGQAGPNPCLPGANPIVARIDQGRAPNAGIWRLIWWLALAPRGDDRAQRVERAGVSKLLLDRMVGGEVVPEPWLAIAIAQATDGQVLPEDFELATYRGPVQPHWSEMPAPRGAPRREDTIGGVPDHHQNNPDQEQDHDS